MLDENNRRYIANGKIIQLTRIETVTLNELIKNKEIVTTYEMLQNATYGSINLVRNVIKRLRIKLEGILDIKTKYQIGYYIK